MSNELPFSLVLILLNFLLIKVLFLLQFPFSFIIISVRNLLIKKCLYNDDKEQVLFDEEIIDELTQLFVEAQSSEDGKYILKSCI